MLFVCIIQREESNDFSELFFWIHLLITFNKSFVEQKKFTLDFGHLRNFPHAPITYNKQNQDYLSSIPNKTKNPFNPRNLSSENDKFFSQTEEPQLVISPQNFAESHLCTLGWS